MSVAEELARTGEDDVTLMGSGPVLSNRSYRFIHVNATPRERFEKVPKFPPFRGETVYEEATFAAGMLGRFRTGDYDVTITCSYPFVNWVLRRPTYGPVRPKHVFVTQNGDWPAHSSKSEFRFFGCDGLVCTNPDYYERNRKQWNSVLIPNGTAINKFGQDFVDRARFRLPAGPPMVLMVSALIESKRVADAIRAVGLLTDVYLVCAGDGPLRDEIDSLAAHHLPGRFSRLTLDAEDMPALYRTANAFLHLSRDESFGNVYVEAMASGLPIVAQDLPRTRWIVGDDEFLCDASDASILAATVGRALAAPRRDAALIAKKVTRFGWPRIAAQYREFLMELVTRR